MKSILKRTLKDHSDKDFSTENRPHDGGTIFIDMKSKTASRFSVIF